MISLFSFPFHPFLRDLKISIYRTFCIFLPFTRVFPLTFFVSLTFLHWSHLPLLESLQRLPTSVRSCIFSYYLNLFYLSIYLSIYLVIIDSFPTKPAFYLSIYSFNLPHSMHSTGESNSLISLHHRFFLISFLKFIVFSSMFLFCSILILIFFISSLFYFQISFISFFVFTASNIFSFFSIPFCSIYFILFPSLNSSLRLFLFPYYLFLSFLLSFNVRFVFFLATFFAFYFIAFSFAITFSRFFFKSLTLFRPLSLSFSLSLFLSLSFSLFFFFFLLIMFHG
ncbi:unnamed protein product [Acanthosepion pharaonis]|uniref:Uncharacterized protein n=1 Tax=Acanthosepion pharaonis TaxID=158019 RepID=A0A812BGS8_ACAPH|nr:unnamed protein product [Sepia pharaonis]